MEKKKTDLKEILSFLLILAGSAILAINMNTFVEQGGLVPGGFSGLSKLIQRVALTFFGLKIPFTLLNVFFNAIPAMLAYRFVGKKFTILSCISIVVVSVLVDQLPVTPITGDILLISVFGGIINGLGMSLILNNNASSGGTDFIAMTLSAKYKISTFNYMLLFSAAVILTSGFLFGMDKALYSIIFQFCSTQAIQILYKRYKKETLFIISDYSEQIYKAIRETTNHDATLFQGIGCYEEKEKTLIYSVINTEAKRQLIPLIRSIDSHAFINIVKPEELAGRFHDIPND